MNSSCILLPSKSQLHIVIQLADVLVLTLKVFLPRLSAALPIWPQRYKEVTGRPGLRCRPHCSAAAGFSQTQCCPCVRGRNSELGQWGLLDFSLPSTGTQEQGQQAPQGYPLLPTEIQPRLWGPKPGPAMPHPSVKLRGLPCLQCGSHWSVCCPSPSADTTLVTLDNSINLDIFYPDHNSV